MTEANNTDAQTSEAATEQQQTPQHRSEPTQSEPTTTTEDRFDEMVPRRTLAEMSKRANAAEKQLAQIRQEQEQKQEQQAQAQGEWQQVADKRQKKIDSLNQQVTNLQNQIVRDKRFRAWTQGASGIIRADAMGDAFGYITDDEWQSVNEEDENSIKMLAQGLAERKNFLANGPIGSGSGGSSRPVFGSNVPSNRDVKDNRAAVLSSGRQAFNFSKKKRHW